MKDLSAISNQFEKLSNEKDRQSHITKATTHINGDSCYVAYLDLDGFKNRIYQNAEVLYKDFQNVTKTIVNIICLTTNFGNEKRIIESHSYEKVLLPLLFSDSYFIATIDDSEESLIQISTISAMMMNQGLRIGLMTRGAISKGPIFFNPSLNILIGDPIIKAHRIASEMDYFGVEVDDEIVINRKNLITDNIEIQTETGILKRRFALSNAYCPSPLMKDQDLHANQKFNELLKNVESKPEISDAIKGRYRRSKQIINAMYPDK